MDKSGEVILRLRSVIAELEREVSVGDILKVIASWAQEGHSRSCAGILCRHQRAKDAMMEIANAIAECERNRAEK